MGLLVCSFVFLPFSEPAWVFNSPISLSGAARPKGSEFACLPRRVSQPTEVENTARGINGDRAVISKAPLALPRHRRGCTGACETSSFIARSQASHPQAPVPLSLAVPPCWGTKTNVALWPASPARRTGGWTACSRLSAKKPSATFFVSICFKHVPLGYQHLVCAS